MLSVEDVPVSVAALMSGTDGPEANGAVHGAAGPGASPYSKIVPSAVEAGLRPSHVPRLWLLTARSASLI